MISRRNLLSGLAASTAAGCSAAPRAPLAPYQVPVAPPPPDRASLGLDAVIDISRFVTVTDFRLVRQSNILGVIHKATEGGDYADPVCAARRPQAEAAGLLWGAYHFGTGQMSGAQQAAFFLSVRGPVPGPSWRSTSSSTKTIRRTPCGSTRPRPSCRRWPRRRAGCRSSTCIRPGPTAIRCPIPAYSLDARITPDSILARCGLWVADYHDSPEIPLAWAASGWRLWQYAGDESAGRPAYGQTSIVRGVSHCDRNLFNGDATALYRFWSAGD